MQIEAYAKQYYYSASYIYDKYPEISYQAWLTYLTENHPYNNRILAYMATHQPAGRETDTLDQSIIDRIILNKDLLTLQAIVKNYNIDLTQDCYKDHMWYLYGFIFHIFNEYHHTFEEYDTGEEAARAMLNYLKQFNPDFEEYKKRNRLF